MVLKEEVSLNPSSGGVTRPTRPKDRDAQIDEKLKLYSIGTAFANNKYPSNKQIDIALNSALQSDVLARPSKDLSDEGKQIVQELSKLIEQAKVLLLTKNSDEHVQKFLWYATHGNSAGDIAASQPVSGDKAQNDAKDAGQSLLQLGKLIITNGQFRKLVSDGMLLVRDMGADVVAQGADQMRPAQEDLENIDKPAPPHQFASLPGEDANGGGINLQQQQQQLLGGQLGSTNGSTSDIKNKVGDMARSAVSQQGQQMQQQLQSTNAATAEKGKTDNRTDNPVANYFNNKVPENVRDSFIERLRKMVIEIQEHDQYGPAIDTLIALVEEYTHHVQRAASESTEKVKQADTSNVEKSVQHLRTLLENFANYSSLDDVFDAVKAIADDSNNDPELESYLHDSGEYIKRCLKEKGYVLKDQCEDDGKELRDRGKYFVQDRYKDHFDNLRDELERWFKAFDEDAENRAFANQVQTFMNRVGKYRSGKFQISPQLQNDLGNVILPQFLSKLEYVPLPRIEVSDPSMDAIVENLVIEGRNLMPNLIEVQTDHFFRYSAHRNIGNKMRNTVNVHVSQVQCDLRDVAYYVNRKQGFPSISDKGIADIIMSGSGFSFDMKLTMAADEEKKKRKSFFNVSSVRVSVKNLEIRLKESNHKTLFGIFRPLLLKVVRPALQRSLEQQIQDSFQKLDTQVYAIHRQAKATLEEAAESGDTNQATSILKAYFESIQQTILDLSNKSAETASKVNVATTMHSSKFKNIQFKNSISQKSTKYNEEAKSGKDWHSPAFDVGSKDKASSKLPEPQKITRKSPSAAYTMATINGATL